MGIYEGVNIDTIKANNIYIYGEDDNVNSQYMGGTFGLLKYGNIANIYGNNVNIDVKGHYVGGLIGYMSNTTGNAYSSKIQIMNSNIKGGFDVGGVVGLGGFNEDIMVSNCTVEGEKNIGGVTGNQDFDAGNLKNTTIIDTHVKGIENIGGIVGTGGNINLSKVIGTTIEGMQSNSVNVGGIVGTQGWSTENTYVKDSKVISKGINVGGISGYGKASLAKVFTENTLVEGYANVGGIVGKQKIGNISNLYANANVVAVEHSAGGLVGYLNNKDMNNLGNISQIRQSYYAGGTIKSKENVGGIIGEIEKELYMADSYYKENYIEAKLQSSNLETISLGIGNIPKENKKLINTYYYKYSTINEEYPNEKNELYISNENYLVEEELKQIDAYRKKLKWYEGSFNYEVLNENKYPLIMYAGKILEGQEGITIPTDPILNEFLENSETDNNLYSNKDLNKNLQYTFNYNGKIIRTYETSSEIISEDKSRVVRNDVRLYVKDGNLYALPVTLDIDGNRIKLLEKNFIIDTYNGKEYETVLGSDGKMYDLKEPITYPENFVNEDIESIGNNLDYVSNNNESSNKEENLHEVEVIYKNGDKLKFNYQTGEIISSTEESSNKISLFNYMKEKISELGNSNSGEAQQITTKYQKSKVLQNKLEETPVEEAMKKQNNNKNKVDNVTTDENNEANDSLKETRYISIYNVEKDNYQIYQEEELLDTTKQEVISENEKIEANNLKEYYASEGEAKNTKMGIVWIALSIVGVIVILFAIKKRN